MKESISLLVEWMFIFKIISLIYILKEKNSSGIYGKVDKKSLNSEQKIKNNSISFNKISKSVNYYNYMIDKLKEDIYYYSFTLHPESIIVLSWFTPCPEFSIVSHSL